MFLPDSPKLDQLNDLVIDAARLSKEHLEEADFWSAAHGAALRHSTSKKLAAPLPACAAHLDTIASVQEPTVTSGQTLAKVPIFSGLTESELAFLTQHAVPRRYAAGELVFGEGEPCTGLYVVESGNVRIFKSSASGREQVLGIEGPGSSVAELPVFDGGNYPASVAAGGSCN